MVVVVLVVEGEVEFEGMLSGEAFVEVVDLCLVGEIVHRKLGLRKFEEQSVCWYWYCHCLPWPCQFLRKILAGSHQEDRTVGGAQEVAG